MSKRIGVVFFVCAAVLAMVVGVALLQPRALSPTGGATVPGVQVPLVAAQTPVPSTITVTGVGTAKDVPDIAYVTVGVESTKATAREAQHDVAGKVAAVLAAIMGMGVAEKDIRTTGLGLSPVYDRNSAITGYRASNEVRVTVQDINKTGEVLDAAVAAGANRGGQIQMSFKDDSGMRLEALQGAVRSAEERARAIAKAAGATVVGVESLVEEYAAGPAPRELAAMAVDNRGPATPVMPGELTVTARVRAVYRFR